MTETNIQTKIIEFDGMSEVYNYKKAKRYLRWLNIYNLQVILDNEYGITYSLDPSKQLYIIYFKDKAYVYSPVYERWQIIGQKNKNVWYHSKNSRQFMMDYVLKDQYLEN